MDLDIHAQGTSRLEVGRVDNPREVRATQSDVAVLGQVLALRKLQIFVGNGIDS